LSPILKESARLDFLRQWTGVILVVAGLARAFLLVAHEPVMGYANQYDMHRTSACLGLFPAKESANPFAPTPDGPISVYRLGARTSGCYLSTEVAIVATTVAATRAVGADMSHFRLQWVGYARIAILFGTALLLAWLLRDHPWASLVHGLVVLLVLADPVVTLWFNTLYTEFAAIWALYAIVGAACVLAISERYGFVAWTLLIVGLVGLAFAREQFALLGPALVLAAWPWLWHRSDRMTIAVLVVAVGAGVASFAAVPRPDGVRKANRADAYLGLAAFASSPERGLAILGLPERCAPLVGGSWYRQRGEDLQTLCPEVFNLSSVSFTRFFSEEPRALARALAAGLAAVQSASPPYVGTLEGERGTKLKDLPAWAFSPIDAIASRLPASVFVALTLATFAAAPLALLVLVVMRRWRGDPLAPLMIAMLLGGTAIYTFATTVLGDGLSEASRHYLPGALATWILLIAALAGLPFLFMRWGQAPKEALLEGGVALVALAAAGYGCFAAMQWWESQPLALGVLDEPAGKKVSPAELKLRGWALDPQGVESVEVQAGASKVNAQYGIASDKDIGPLFPGYPDAARSRFSLDLNADALTLAGAPNPVTLVIRVKSRNGTMTEIDRRNLEFTP
jgi:hypothetical protein